VPDIANTIVSAFSFVTIENAQLRIAPSDVTIGNRFIEQGIIVAGTIRILNVRLTVKVIAQSVRVAAARWKEDCMVMSGCTPTCR